KVKARVTSWTDARSKSGQSAQKEQLMWISEIVEYVSHVWDVTGGRNGRKISPALPSTILLLGPKFIPPNYHDHYRRRSAVNIAPRTANLKAVTIVHPVFFPELFNNCPRCNAGVEDLRSNGWTGQGPREVHGLFREEMALGWQIKCMKCKDQPEKGHCFASTSAEFWEHKEHWEVPRTYFLRCYL
ncbi:hypothetical protein BDZ89DRAFT_1182009, partial [Hymenopellis radicata]